MIRSDLIKVGVILAAHGVRGQVKVRSSTEPTKALFTLPLTDASGARSFRLQPAGGRDDALIATVEGINERNAAEMLKGTTLYAPRALLPQLPENHWHGQDLLGLEARLPSGVRYGEVIALHNFGAGDIIELKKPDGQEEMLPFDARFVGEVSLENAYVIVMPPDYIEPEPQHG